MSTLLTRFEMSGEFRGFIQTEKGKRRMIVRVSGEDWRLKVSKEVRKQLDGVIEKGHPIAVTGIQQEDELDGRVKRVVSHARLLSAPQRLPDACAACPIRVCSKKNCWRAGGEALWKALERRVAELGLEGRVRLKTVSCVGRCKCAPNVVCDGHYHERCSMREVDAIIARTVGKD